MGELVSFMSNKKKLTIKELEQKPEPLFDEVRDSFKVLVAGAVIVLCELRQGLCQPL